MMTGKMKWRTQMRTSEPACVVPQQPPQQTSRGLHGSKIILLFTLKICAFYCASVHNSALSLWIYEINIS